MSIELNDDNVSHSHICDMCEDEFETDCVDNCEDKEEYCEDCQAELDEAEKDALED